MKKESRRGTIYVYERARPVRDEAKSTEGFSMRAFHRSLALILAVVLLFSTLALSACRANPPIPPTSDSNPSTPPSESNNGNAVYVPPFIEYPDRHTVPFDEIVYTRPDYDAACAAFAAVMAVIETNEISYAEQLAALRSLYDIHAAVQTAYAYVTLMDHKNSADDYYKAEMTYVTTGYPTFSQSVERLYVACARSPYARDFERDYFETDISKYEDGGDLSDAVVELLAREAELEATYSSLADTLVITYKGYTGTYNEILAQIEKSYRPATQSYLSAVKGLELAYEEQVKEATAELYVSLVKVPHCCWSC